MLPLFLHDRTVFSWVFESLTFLGQLDSYFNWVQISMGSMGSTGKWGIRCRHEVSFFSVFPSLQTISPSPDIKLKDTKQVRLVSIKAERPNHLSRCHQAGGGSALWGGQSVWGSSPTTHT